MKLRRFPRQVPVHPPGDLSPCGQIRVSRLGIRRRRAYIDFNFFML
tara:strand:- start:323 stop:460 length:138 start_codon:yes stop_codon:yes gene_type:complete